MPPKNWSSSSSDASNDVIDLCFIETSMKDQRPLTPVEEDAISMGDAGAAQGCES